MFRCIFAALLGMVILPASSLAEPRYCTVFTEELPPVHYTVEGKRIGIATDLVRAIFARAGLKARIHSYPWKRTYEMTLRTPASFVYTINRTPERERLFHWIGPILSKRTYLYRLAGREDIHVEGPGDLKHYTTTVILGYALTRRLMAMGLRPERELVVVPDKSTQMRVFLSGRADLVTGNEYTIGRALAENGRTLSAVRPVLLMSERGYYLAANRKTSPELIRRLRRANEEIQASGLVEEIVHRYMGEEFTPGDENADGRP